MRSSLLTATVCLVLTTAAVLAPRALGQNVPGSPLEGSWWVDTRSPYVVGRLAFGQTAVAGEFDVSGLAMVRMPVRVAEAEGCRPAELFDVEPVAGGSEPLVFGPRGQLRGTLRLTSRADPACRGTLRIVRGKDRIAFATQRGSNGQPQDIVVRRLTLRGRLTIGNSTLRRVVRLRGGAPSSTTLQQRWQGESPDAHVRGRRIRSNKFGVHLQTSSTLGFPFLDLDASGALRLDGVRTDGVVLNATVAVARNRRGIVRIDTAEGSSADLGVGFGRARHYIGSPLASPSAYHGPLVFVHTRMTPAEGPARRVIVSGQLDLLP